MSSAGLANGIIGGYRMADQDARQDRQEERAIGAQEEQKAWREDQRGYQRQRDKVSDARYEQTQAIGAANTEFNQKLQLDNQALNKKQAKQAMQFNEMKIGNLKREKLKARAIDELKLLEGTGKSFPKELHDELVENGMKTLTPYSWLDEEFAADNLALGPLVNEVGRGNYEAVNSPENLEILSRVYKEQLNKGLGTTRPPFNSKTVSKEFSRFELGPKGKLIPHVRVHLEDGSAYEAPMTLNRSSDPDDPVELKDAGMLMDDTMGRFQMARLAQNKEAMGKIKSAHAELFVSNGGAPQSATGKTIKDLVGFGVTQEEAIKLATQSKSDPAGAAASFAKSIMKIQADAGEDVDPRAAYAQAIEILSSQNASTTKAGSAGDASVPAKKPGAGDTPPVPGARKAPDGFWYVQGDDGKYSKVEL